MPLCAAWVFVQSGHCLLQLGSHALLAPPRCHHHPPLFPHHTPAPAHIVAAHHPSSSILIADHLVAARLPAALPPATPLNITPAQPTHMLKDRLAMLLQVPPRSDSFNLNAQTLGLYLGAHTGHPLLLWPGFFDSWLAARRHPTSLVQ
eukprot:m.252067 g.252067  ORF g.252067 m.252067 type:complete len:148 (-) comp54516_c0_seq4:63-506(-)